MIARIMSKKAVIEQLESLKSSAEYMSHKKDNNEMLVKDATALNAAIYYLKEKRKEDISIIKTSILLTFIILTLILFIWNMG